MGYRIHFSMWLANGKRERYSLPAQPTVCPRCQGVVLKPDYDQADPHALLLYSQYLQAFDDLPEDLHV